MWACVLKDLFLSLCARAPRSTAVGRKSLMVWDCTRLPPPDMVTALTVTQLHCVCDELYTLTQSLERKILPKRVFAPTFSVMQSLAQRFQWQVWTTMIAFQGAQFCFAIMEYKLLFMGTGVLCILWCLHEEVAAVYQPLIVKQFGTQLSITRYCMGWIILIILENKGFHHGLVGFGVFWSTEGT